MGSGRTLSLPLSSRNKFALLTTPLFLDIVQTKCLNELVGTNVAKACGVGALLVTSGKILVDLELGIGACFILDVTGRMACGDG